MKDSQTIRSMDISRRGLLRRAALIAGGGALMGAAGAASSASAQQKMAQTIAHYQAAPKGAARCDKCAQFQAPGSCKLVDGKISPSGWCMLFTAKAPS